MKKLKHLIVLGFLSLGLVKKVKKRKALRQAVHISVFPFHLAAAIM